MLDWKYAQLLDQELYTRDIRWGKKKVAGYEGNLSDNK